MKLKTIIIVTFSIVIFVAISPKFLWTRILDLGNSIFSFQIEELISESLLYQSYMYLLYENSGLQNCKLKHSQPSFLPGTALLNPDNHDLIQSKSTIKKMIKEIVKIHKSPQIGHNLPYLVPKKEYVTATLSREASNTLQAALSQKKHGRYEKSRKLLEHAKTLDPNNPAILTAYGEMAELDTDLVLAEHYYTRAVIQDPANQRALQNRRRTLPLVEEIDQRRFNEIDRKVHEFYRIPESHPGLRRTKKEQYFRHIFHSNAIEGNTLNLAQTRSILETRIAIGGKSLVEQNEVLGLDAALKYLNTTLMRRNAPIELEDILEIHKRVLGFVDLTEAGRFRLTQVFIADYVPPPAPDLPELMTEFITWLNSYEVEELHAIELAALAHWKLVYIHPFYDGNGRTARLLMNLVLMRGGYPPAIISVDERHLYYEYIKQANDGDVRPFIRFIAVLKESMSFTGDLKNSIEALRRQLRRLKITKEVDFQSLVTGNSWGFITLYRFLLCDYNADITSNLIEKGFELTGTSDYRFMETVYRILRDTFDYKPKLTLPQFFSTGFPERKLLMAVDICAQLHHMASEMTTTAVAVGPHKTGTGVKHKNIRKKKASSDDGIEIVEYGDLSKSQPRAGTAPLPPRGGGSSSKHGSKKPPSSLTSVGGGGAFKSKKSRPASGSLEGRGRRSHGGVGGSLSDSEMRANDVKARAPPHQRDTSQMQLLSHLLEGRTASGTQPTRSFGSRSANCDAYGDNKAARLTNSAQTDTLWEVTQAGDSAHAINSVVTKISCQLDNLIARMTLLETRMENVEDKMASRTSNPKTTINGATITQSSQQPLATQLYAPLDNNTRSSSGGLYVPRSTPSSSTTAAYAVSKSGLAQGLPMDFTSITGINNGSSGGRPADHQTFNSYQQRPTSSAGYTSQLYGGDRDYSLPSSYTETRPYSAKYQFNKEPNQLEGPDRSHTTSSYLPPRMSSNSRTSPSLDLPVTSKSSSTFLAPRSSATLKLDLSQGVSTGSGALAPQSQSGGSVMKRGYTLVESPPLTPENKENQAGMGPLPPNTYRDQADRIASMLAETQCLLGNN